MKRVLAVLVALSLVMSMFTGVFAPVPEARAAGPDPVVLGTAGNFVVLAETAITATGATSITGDIGISPYGASSITGFGLIMDSSNTFSTSSLVTGKVYAADYYPPTPTNMGIAVGDMYTAYTNAAGRITPDGTELYGGNLGGQTFAPGLYKWGTNVIIPTDVTLSGGANDVWIFQIAGDLNIASAGDVVSGIKVVLAGGAQASNVFWQVGGPTGAILGTYSTFNGIILSAKQIILQTGAVLYGKALAQTQVTLDGNSILAPTSAERAGYIIVDKVTNPSGDPQSFNFTVASDLYAWPNFSLTDATTPHSGALVPGTYSVSETNISAGWVLTNVTKEGAAFTDATAFTLGAGETIHLVYTNTHLGTITVVKDTVPNGPQDFSFTTTGGLTPATFTLDDDAADATLLNTQVFNNVPPGTYTITEGAAAGYTLTSITGATLSDLGTRTATVTLAAGGAATVTFTNVQPGTITVVKDTVPNGPQDFSFTTTGGLYAPTFSLDDDAADATLLNTQVFNNVPPGTYTITEGAAAGYTLTSITGATLSDLGTRTATVTLAAGGAATVTFTNVQPGTITVVKDTVPNGPQDFSFTTTGGLYAPTFSLDDDDTSLTPLNTQVFNNVPPGTYTITEGAAAGYTLTSITGATLSDLGTGKATVTLAAGGAATVTFTNTGAPGIHLGKVVKPTGAVLPGTRLTYTLSYSNTGTAASSPLTITDRLDDWLDEAKLSIGQGGLYNRTTRIITWNVGIVPAGASGTVTFAANVRPLQNVSLVIHNTGLYTTTLGGTGQSNTVETPVLLFLIVPPPVETPVIPPPPPSIAIDVTAPEPLCVDAYLPYKICFTNGIPPYTYTVDFGDGTPIVTGTTSSPCVTLDHAYLDVKQYSFHVTVHDSQGIETTHQETFTTEDCTEKIVVYHHNFFIGYPDGTFQPEGNITRAEISAAMSRALGLGWSNEQPGFPDVKPTHWAAGFITLMKQEGFMQGDTGGTFRPDEPMTRAEAAAVFLRIAGMSPVLNLTSSSFSDVQPMSWAAGYIEAARQAGLLAGYPDNTFRPADLLSRAEFATLASDALGRKLTSTNSLVNPEYVVQWPDVSRDFWAYDYISEVTTPHTVTNPTRLTRIITLKERKIPLFTEGVNGIVTFLRVGDTITAIVPVDGLQPDGSDPAPRQVKVRIINHERP